MNYVNGNFSYYTTLEVRLSDVSRKIKDMINDEEWNNNRSIDKDVAFTNKCFILSYHI